MHERTWLVQRFIDAAFPELSKRDLTASVSFTGPVASDWKTFRFVSLQLRERSSDAADSRAQEDELLSVFCAMSSTGTYLETATFSGRYVHQREGRRLVEELRKQPAPTASTVGAALRRFGAKYGPAERAAFLQALNIERFEGVLGEVVTKEVDFVWRRESRNRSEIFTPAWYVSLRTAPGTREHKCYSLTFEPIDGRLTSLHDTPPCS